MKKFLFLLFLGPLSTNGQKDIKTSIWTVEQWGQQQNWRPTNERPHFFYAESQGKLIQLEFLENEGKINLSLREVSFPERTKIVTEDATASIMPTKRAQPQIKQAEMEGSFNFTKIVAIIFVAILVYAIFATEHILGQLFWFALAMWAANSFLI